MRGGPGRQEDSRESREWAFRARTGPLEAAGAAPSRRQVACDRLRGAPCRRKPRASGMATPRNHQSTTSHPSFIKCKQTPLQPNSAPAPLSWKLPKKQISSFLKVFLPPSIYVMLHSISLSPPPTGPTLTVAGHFSLAHC